MSARTRAAGAVLPFLVALAGCHANDYVVVKLEAATGLPPIAQLTLVASDSASSSTATQPATPVAAGITFPETYVVSAPHSGAVGILVTGLGVNGGVLARGSASAIASGNVQAVVVTLTASCTSPLDCDPASVCSGAVTCGDAGACIPGNGNVVPNGTGCGADGGLCQLGSCLLPEPCQSELDCDPQGVCSGAVFCSDAGACLPGSGVVAANGIGCGQDGGVCEGGGCVIPFCGLGIVVPPEQCNYGPDGGPFGLGDDNAGVCTAACLFAFCGDGYVNIDPLSDGGFFHEGCDWGSGADGGDCSGPDGGCNSDTLPDHCREDCLPARCGDGVVDTGERCDLGPPSPDGDGGNATGSGCNATCTLLEEVTTIGGSPCPPTTDGCQGLVNGPGAQSQFFFPSGVTVASGASYIADKFNNVIRSVDLSSDVVATLVGNGAHKTVNGIGDAGSFYAPLGIAAFQGGLAVVEPSNVRLVTFAGQVTTLTGLPNGESGFVDGPFASAEFGEVEGIQGIATDGLNLYVADPPNIRFLNLDAGVVSTIQATDAGEDETSVPAGIVYLNGLVYTADKSSSVVESLNPTTGAIVFIAGKSGGDTLVDGIGSQAAFNVPTGLCTDGQTLYVADLGNNAIRQVDPLTGQVTTVAGDGMNVDLDGTGRQAGFAAPSGCAYEPTSGDLIVTDQLGNEIRRIH
jgi:hypothetical protein